jgi:hypothetical protein
MLENTGARRISSSGIPSRATDDAACPCRSPVIAAVSAAVLCAADGCDCDHLDCCRHDDGGAFRVVLMGSDLFLADLAYAYVYSSETRAWSAHRHVFTAAVISTPCTCRRGALVNDEIYFIFSQDDAILKYDWGNNSLSTVKSEDTSTVLAAGCGVEEKHENQGREAGIEEGRDRYGSMAGCTCTRRKTNSMFGLQFNR